jgi:polysaccharide biosynthesis protein PslH
MNLLWIKSDFPLPADTGGKIRTLNLLTALTKRCDVTFLSYVPPDLDTVWLKQMSEHGIHVESVMRREENKEGIGFKLRVLANILSSRPYIVNKYISREMARRIRATVHAKLIDVVVCDFLEMAWCGEHIERVPKFLFEHNVETLIWRRYHEVEKSFFKKLYFAYEKRRLERFERESCRRFDDVLTVSDIDGELLQREFGLKRYVTIPTGVDTDFFYPTGPEIGDRVVFCGSMDWMPNIDGFWWFYRSVLPRIRSRIPGLTFAVVGRRPGADIIRAGQGDNSIIITGTVDDVRPWVAGGQVYVVPLRIGGGTRIKIYEAMAMRRCVVSTTIGAEGLPVTDGHDIVLVDDEREFAERVTELLRDEEKRSRIAEAGYRLVKDHYSWHKAASRLHDALQAAVGGC